MKFKTKLLILNCMPLVVFAAISLMLGLIQFRSSLYLEKEGNLKSTALAALTLYSSHGYGDYNLKSDGNVWRGMNFNISEKTSIVDDLKKQTGVDITFFFDNKAVMTSILDEENNRSIGMTADYTIQFHTLKQGSQLWCKEIFINGKNCQAYVIPIRQESDDSIIGALMASQSAEQFNITINKYILTTVVSMFLILFTVFFFIRWHVDWFYQKFSEVKDKSRQDLLTGLLNKLSFEDEVKKIISHKKENEISVLFILDFDYFKNVNDNFGHQVGDEALKEFSKILLRAFRTKDIIGRIGGDEFMVYMPEMEESFLERADEIAQEILRELYKVKLGEAEHFSCSIGIGIDEENYKFQQLYELADKALYRAKENGRACFVRLSSKD